MWCSKSTKLKFSANHGLRIWYNFTRVCVYAWVLVKTADAKPTNREDQLYQPSHGNLSILGFWYPWVLLEPVPQILRNDDMTVYITDTRERKPRQIWERSGQKRDFRKFSLSLFSLFLPFSELWCCFLFSPTSWVPLGWFLNFS